MCIVLAIIDNSGKYFEGSRKLQSTFSGCSTTLDVWLFELFHLTLFGNCLIIVVVYFGDYILLNFTKVRLIFKFTHKILLVPSHDHLLILAVVTSLAEGFSETSQNQQTEKRKGWCNIFKMVHI